MTELVINFFPSMPAERVEFSMAKVGGFLYSRQQANIIPTEKNPVILRSEDYFQIRYLWTALMVFGKQFPELKFGPQAIVVISPCFNPKTELGWLGAFSKKSFYEQSFKYHLTDNMIKLAEYPAGKEKDNSRYEHFHKLQSSFFSGQKKPDDEMRSSSFENCVIN